MFRNHPRRFIATLLILLLLIPATCAHGWPMTISTGQEPPRYVEINSNLRITVNTFTPYNIYISDPTVIRITNLGNHSFALKFLKLGSATLTVAPIGKDFTFSRKFDQAPVRQPGQDVPRRGRKAQDHHARDAAQCAARHTIFLYRQHQNCAGQPWHRRSNRL